MSYLIKTMPALALLLILAFLAPAHATEWNVGAPFDPPTGSKCYGVASVNFGGFLWIFENNGTGKLLIRKTSDATKWLPNNSWNSIALPRGISSDAAPALTVFNGSIYLFVKTTGGLIYSNHTTNANGTVWAGWQKLVGSTNQSVAAAVQTGILYLFAREPISGHVNYCTFNGSAWSAWAPINKNLKIVTNTAPAAMTLSNKLCVFITGTRGQVSVAQPPFPNDKQQAVGTGADPYTAPTATISGGRLFLFAKDKQKHIRYRLLDRTQVAYGGAATWIPVDDWNATSASTALSLWMPAGSGYSDSFIAAGALNKSAAANDRVFIFSWRDQCVPVSPTISISKPRLFAHWADWTNIRIHVFQAADNDCSNPATTAGFSEMLRYANSTYAPGMIRFNWDPTTDLSFGAIPGTGFTTCNDSWNVEKMPAEADAQVSGAADAFPGKLVVLIRQSSGGSGSGPGMHFIKFIELYRAPTMCGDPKNLFHSLGHEIGHYFSLPHTFPNDADNNVLKTKADVQDLLTQAGNKANLALDNDAHTAGKGWQTWPIMDTPPDPYWESPGTTTKCVADPIVFNAGVNLYPPRTNAMSYYQSTPTSIQKLSPQQFHNIYNWMFERGFLGDF